MEQARAGDDFPEEGSFLPTIRGTRRGLWSGFGETDDIFLTWVAVMWMVAL